MCRFLGTASFETEIVNFGLNHIFIIQSQSDYLTQCRSFLCDSVFSFFCQWFLPSTRLGVSTVLPALPATLSLLSSKYKSVKPSLRINQSTCCSLEHLLTLYSFLFIKIKTDTCESAKLYLLVVFLWYNYLVCGAVFFLLFLPSTFSLSLLILLFLPSVLIFLLHLPFLCSSAPLHPPLSGKSLWRWI